MNVTVLRPTLFAESSRLFCIITLRFQRNQCREALHLFQTILDCQRRLHGELHADVGSAWHNVGIALLRAKRHDQALQVFEKAVHVRKDSLGKNRPEVAVRGKTFGVIELCCFVSMSLTRVVCFFL